jgi:polar amino acid transport system permease protein
MAFLNDLRDVLGSLPLFIRGLLMTVAVSALSLGAGTAVGFALGVVRASRYRVLRSGVGAWVDFVRGTPFLVQVFVVFFILPEVGFTLEAFSAAVVALGNMSACFICEIVAAGLASVPRGQREARAVSASTPGRAKRDRRAAQR